MKSRIVKGVEHFLYTREEALEKGIGWIPWREGKKGDWVETDDGNVVQVLNSGKFFHKATNRYNTWIRTICGTFNQQQSKYMGSDFYDSIYGFSRTNKRNKSAILKSRELLFAKFFVDTGDELEAYKRAFRDDKNTRMSVDAMRMEARKLLKLRRIQNLIKRDVYEALMRADIDYDWIVNQLKEFTRRSKLDRDKIRALENIIEISGIKDREEHTEQEREFQGFSREQLKDIDDDQMIEREIQMKQIEKEVKR